MQDASQLPTPAPAAQIEAPAQPPTPTPITEDGHRLRYVSEPPRRERIDEFYTKSSTQNGKRGRKKGRRPNEPGDISLKFQNADLRAVVRAILGDILKRNFVIDPNVTGKVTLTTDRPLRKDEIVPILEAILASQGAKLVDFGSVYRITRSTNPSALAGGGIDVSGKAVSGRGNLRIFPLDFITAEAMAKILNPLLPEGSLVHADKNRNILIIAGSGPELRLAASTVEIFDVDQMSDQGVLMISVETADARTIVAELRAIFGADSKSGGPAELVRFMPIDRLNAILVMSAQRAYIDKARNWIYRLDRKRDPNERRLFVYYVQNGRASKLAEGLREIVGEFKGDGIADVRAKDSGAKPADAKGYKTPSTTKVSANSTILGKGLRISVDTEHNALLVSATPKDFTLIQDVLAKLDLQPLQVMVEVTIFEVTLGDELRYGIQYAISNGGLGLSDDGTAGLTRSTATATSQAIITPLISPLLPGFSFTLEGASRTRLVIDMLSDLTEVKVISSPNVLVLNNQVAQLHIGDEVPIVTQTTTSTLTENPLIVNTVQYRNTGVNLEVTPHVNASGMVTLEIAQNVSDVTVTTTSNIDSPTIQNRRLVSTVNVKSGDTVMLGGLIREQSVSTDRGLPFLHDLPLIGALFGQKANTADRTELVVLIRPVIAATPDDARKITGEMRRKFQSLLHLEHVSIRQPRSVSRDN